MRKFNLYTAALAALLALAACSDKEENNGGTPEGRTPLQVTNAAITGRETGTTTRATDNAWQAGDAIGITLVDADNGTPVDGKNTCRYITANADGLFSPADEANTAYYPLQEKQADVMAFYPWSEIGADLTVPVSTADQTDLSAIDLMAADISRGHSEARPEVTLTFRHKLVKLVISVSREETAELIDLAGATLTLSGTHTSARWNLAEARLTDLAQVKDIAIPAAYDAEAGTLTATAICLPAEAGAGVVLHVITADGRTFDAPLEAGTALAPGTVNTLGISLSLTEAKVNASVTDWTTGVTVDLPSLGMDVSATDGTAEGIDQLTLWTARAPQAKAVYTFSGSSWSSPTPFYLENLAADDAFYARHTPTATDDITQLADVLGNTTPATISGGGIGIALQHLYAQLTVIATDYNEASIGGMLMKGEPDDTNRVVPDEESASTLHATGGTPMIVVPQTLEAGTLISSGGYSGTLTEDLVMEPGKSYTLTVSTSSTEMKIDVSVDEWGEGGAASAGLVIDGITPGTTTTDQSITAKDGDQLDIRYIDGTSLSSEVQGLYTYSGTAWTGAPALYWDDISKGDSKQHTFAALYTPKADGTPEKDYMSGLSAAADFGSAISLGLKHAMSQLTVKLKAGRGYNDATLQAAMDKVTLNTQRLATENPITLRPDGKCDYQLATSSSPYELISTDKAAIIDPAGVSCLLAPQTLTNGQTIVLTLQNGNTYTLELKDISLTTTGGDTTGSTTGKLTQLAAGTAYVLTLTVSETEVGIELTLNPWDNQTGTGELTPDIPQAR